MSFSLDLSLDLSRSASTSDDQGTPEQTTQTDQLYLLYDRKAHFKRKGVWASEFSESPFEMDADEWKYRSVYTYKAPASRSGDPIGDAPYDAEVFFLDIDEKSPYEALAALSVVRGFFRKHGIPHYVWYSGGKGYHVEIHKSVVGWEPSNDLSARFQYLARELQKRIRDEMGYHYRYDSVVYGRDRKYRMPLCRHERTGRYKTLLPSSSLQKGPSHILGATQKRREPPIKRYVESEQSEYLREIWDAYEPYQGSVEVRHSQIVENAGYINLDGIDEALLSHDRDAEDRGDRISCKCLFHEDRSPSAVLFRPTRRLYCSVCDRTWGPSTVARALGFNLERATENGIEEAREEAARRIREIVAANQSAALEVPVGVGKTHYVREILREQGKSALYLADTHDLMERHQLESGGEGSHLAKYETLEPRCRDLPYHRFRDDEGNAPLNVPSRARAIELRPRQDKGPICGTCPLNPNSKHWDPEIAGEDGACNYQLAKSAEKTDESGGSTSRMWKGHLSMKDLLAEYAEGHDYLVCDEDTVEFILPTHTAPLAAVRRALRAVGDQVAPAKSLGLTYWRDLLEPLLAGEMPESLRQLDLKQYESSASVWSWDVEDSGSHDAVDKDGDIDSAEVEVGFDSYGLDREATELLMTIQRGISHVRVWEDYEGQEFVSLRGPARLYDLDIPVLILDASMHEMDLHIYRIWKPELQHIKIGCANRDSKIIQDPSASWARSCQGRFLKRHEGYVEGSEEVEGPDRLGRLIERIRRDLRDGEGVGIIGHGSSGGTADDGLEIINPCGSVAQIFSEVRGLDLQGDFMWYGNLKGSNQLEGKTKIYVLGSASVNGAAYEIEMCRLALDISLPLSWDTGYEAEDGSYKITGYPMRRPLTYEEAQEKYGSSSHSEYRKDPETGALSRWDRNEGQTAVDVGHYLLHRLERAPLYQAVGRARPFGSDVTVVVLAGYDSPHEGLDYEVRPDYLGSKAEGVVMDQEQYRVASYLVNQTYIPYTEIERRTGLDRRTVKGLEYVAREVRRKSEINRMMLEGKDVKQMVESTGLSKTTVYKVKKQVEDELR